MSSPILAFSEDLSRFPSESLHSFSFAHQSEEALHNRQNVLKRSIDFMKDKLAWAANNPGLVNAHAKVTGDQEVQSMMELLQRANLLGPDALQAQGLGFGRAPLTGPAHQSSENLFEKSFAPLSESPPNITSPINEMKENRLPHERLPSAVEEASSPREAKNQEEGLTRISSSDDRAAHEMADVPAFQRGLR
ncbi:serine/threonine protein kinase [Taxawa tesnikishii (nom. ined.)]|nr:serine/threonine protein kinase [Dothideales sp. JES 119]